MYETKNISEWQKEGKKNENKFIPEQTKEDIWVLQFVSMARAMMGITFSESDVTSICELCFHFQNTSDN